MNIKIALAGNPNCGKTTLFNALTGSNQYVGNWPGVTVEKKEGKLKGHKEVIIQDLPGIYSLSPYTLEEVVARDRAESTLYAYRNMARCHVLPALGRIPLAELTPLRIQGYLYEKMNQGLSPNTVIKHYVMLTTALGMAVRLEMLERSPMDRVTPPKKKEARFSFYSPEQLQLLFSAVSGTMMELPVKLAAYLGLRRSEICGLRWENVDLEAGLLSIREVRTEVGGSVVLKSPKTRTSARRLGITGLQDLQQVLRRAWERRRSDDPKEWVVLRQDGSGLRPA